MLTDMTDALSRGEEQSEDRSRRRWHPGFWIAEFVSIAVILVVVLLLQYSEEGYMRRHGIRVTATVDELPVGKDTCTRCPLIFTMGEERHGVEESLLDSGEERYVPGEAIDLYVDPNDMTHVIDVSAVEENIALGLIGIVVAAVVAVGLPVYEFKRPVSTPSITHAPR